MATTIADFTAAATLETRRQQGRPCVVRVRDSWLATFEIVAPLTAGDYTRTELTEETNMFGLVGKFTAHAGKREELISVLADASSALPGCLSYIVARDASDADTIWITEVWDGSESHAASLKLPAVQQAIQKARPWIRGMERIATTEPVSGLGLSAS